MARRIVVAGAAIAVLLFGGALVIRQLRDQRAPAAGSAPATAASGAGAAKPATRGANAPAGKHIRLVDAQGEVRISHAGKSWEAARSGDELYDEDAIRTGETGSAVLESGEHTTVRMVARSEFSVAQISEHVARLRLEQGRVAAAVRGGGQSKLLVNFRGSHAVAEAVQGEFSALTDGRGLVSVAASAGQVRLSAQRGTVDIVAGEQSSVQGDEAPAPPTHIPASLFLKVGRPAQAGGADVVLHGSTAPGALVSINGRDIVVGKQGAFEARVPVKEGANEIVVKAEDVLGRRETARQAYVLPGSARDKAPAKTSDDLESNVTW